MAIEVKPGFCVICCRRHYFDVACDPTDKRYTANARALGAALAIEEMTAGPKRPREPFRRMSYAEEVAWNDPWWTE